MSKLTRRQAVGAIAGAAAGIAVAGVATASADTSPAKARAAAPGRAGDPAAFDEVFQGRRIQGLPADPSSAHGQAHGQGAHGDGYRVLIDGRELHVMRRSGQSWTSVINHYETFATPRDAARTAVTSLKGASLVPFDPLA
ncbi:tyrosinase cofactor [Streptomyces sp. NPDC051567]|uniref:apotyrosinase chaperone MelC1 n=1 Tax=Streptomyces sp. NPDC051567 TaxID=3365660 RepID=UPI003792B922